jgi:large subunit ribosomal protein L6
VSRIGKKPVDIPEKVQVTLDGNILKAKGPKGEMTQELPPEIEMKLEDNQLIFTRPSEQRQMRAKHGLARSLAFNTVEGVHNGFQKILDIEGIGYRAEMKGDRLLLSVGFSHPILLVAPQGVELKTPSNSIIEVSGVDKQLVGQFAAIIRNIRPPEPYKGKGIRYRGEYVRRKAGKTTAK